VPRAIRIKAQKRLWGSCSSRGVVNLNWRLILAPEAVFEYVVVHELCHLRIRNHQRAFWQLVGEILPDFATHRRWLRDHGHLLTLRPARLEGAPD
jgi:predicted metal-dependent hydrolase